MLEDRTKVEEKARLICKDLSLDPDFIFLVGGTRRMPRWQFVARRLNELINEVYGDDGK